MSFAPEERELREQLVALGIRIQQRGWAAGTGGNLSVRIPGSDEVLVTATEISLGMTTLDNIVKTDLWAVPLQPSSRYRPSKETGFHCAVYRVRPEVQAIVHVHSPYATALSLRHADLPLVTITSVANLKWVPCIDAALSGSDELRRYVEDAFVSPGVRAVLMRAHGVIAAGPDLLTAYQVADMVEDAAEVAVLSASIGIPLVESVGAALRPYSG